MRFSLQTTPVRTYFVLFTLFYCCFAAPAVAQRLVLPGEFPDPSVVKIDGTYWAASSSSNRAPAFPLMTSDDLVTWEFRGHVFPKLPAWADSYFRAPEIFYDSSGVYVYYTARRRGGNLCVGAARANSPEGPYQDLGPIMCQEAGSMDAFPVRDKDGSLYLVWKELGNTVDNSTPIWAGRLADDRTDVVTEPVQLFRNDLPWEKNLVEGVSILRHDKIFYAFYTAATCRGKECTYATGVARAKNLLGPWEKYRANPILTAGPRWKDPGHGTPIERDGRFYLVYDARDASDEAFTGRQGVLSEFTFTPDAWIQFLPDEVVVEPPPFQLTDSFGGSSLSHEWYHSVFQSPLYSVNEGTLTLQGMPCHSGAYVAQKVASPNLEADVVMNPKACSAEAGIALVGDDNNLLRATLVRGKVSLWKINKGKPILLAEKAIRKTDSVTIRVVVREGREALFTYSTNGSHFRKLNTDPVSLLYMEQRDQAVQVALVAIGATDRRGCFEHFSARSRTREELYVARTGFFRRR
jgi:beta-xylosidase